MEQSDQSSSIQLLIVSLSMLQIRDFDEPTSNQIYEIDIASLQVLKSYTGGQAPHGVVVSHDGKKVYVTNLLSDTISVIDTTTDTITNTIAVGEKTNGISIWKK